MVSTTSIGHRTKHKNQIFSLYSRENKISPITEKWIDICHRQYQSKGYYYLNIVIFIPRRSHF